MLNQDLEKVIFHYILKSSDLTSKCRDEFFKSSYLRELFKILKPYVLQYQKIPSVEQVIKLISVSEIPDDIKEYLNNDTIIALWKVSNDMSGYNEDWLSETVKAYLSWQTLCYGFKNAAVYIKSVQSDVTIENYQEICDKAKNIFTKNVNIDFNNTSAGVSIYDPDAHKTKQLQRFRCGYDFIDLCSKGGFWPGSLWCFLGAPKAGKSRMLQNLAAQSVRLGNNSAYLSFELQEEIITQRIGSNLYNIPIDDYDRYADDTEIMSSKIKDFRSSSLIQPGELDIKNFPTSAASVNDVEAWLLDEEERLTQETGKTFKFCNIYVDYINLIKNWRNPNSENTYMKIKQIAEDLRAMGQKNKWCIITATQVKQSFFNMGDMDMSSASESSALSATVDMMFGIITDPMLQAAHQLYLKIIANRVSSHVNERKLFNIEEDYMRVNEDMTSGILKDEEAAAQFAAKSKENVRKMAYHPKPFVPEGSSQAGAANIGVTEAQLNVGTLFNIK